MLKIATTTFYTSPDDLRFKLATKFVKEAVKAGHEVVIVDGSPLPEIGEQLRNLGASVCAQREKGMGPGRREALRLASDSDVIAWVEPEKHPLVPFLEVLAEKVRAGADMVIPRRRSLGSYPKYQEISEHKGNWEAGSMTGRPELDLWFGPRVMNLKGLSHFLAYDGLYEDRWDSIFIPVMWAIADGSRVVSHTVDYVHPAEQTAAEEGDATMDKKRDVQLESLLQAIGAECSKLGLPK